MRLKRILIAITIFVAAGVGIFSMAVMYHGAMESCAIEASAQCDCSQPVHQDNCVDFHFELLGQFSRNLIGDFFLAILSALILLGFVGNADKNLKVTLNRLIRISKARLRQVDDGTILVFYNTLGRWLTILEKRDPACAAVPA